MNAKPDIDEEEKPLDPATENVRRKLARFGALFMGLNMLALMAVLAAIVYRIGWMDDGDTEGTTPSGVSVAAPIEPGFEAEVEIPQGMRLISASQNGTQITLSLAGADGSQVWVYDTARRAVVARLRLR